jgi:hypothetical protein
VILSRLIGASLVLHLVLIALVMYVPAVRDTLNIAAIIAGTEWVDKDYVATQIGDDVQIVKLDEKFRYPDGYFALESQINSEVAAQQQTANAAFAPKIISQWNPKAVDPEASPSPSQSIGFTVGDRASVTRCESESTDPGRSAEET